MTLAFWLALALGTPPVLADSWPGFRGDGTSRTAAQGLPLHWSPSANVAWKCALPGYGQSAPVVWRDRVFLTAVEGSEKERGLVLALDAATGKVVWQRQFPASQKGRTGPTMSRAAPTPLVDAEGVYAFFESGDLIGLSHAGDLKWQRSLVREYGEFQNSHGLASSPAQTERTVVVLVAHGGPSYLLAVDKATGKTLWKAERPSRPSWTSPVVTEQEGRSLVLVSSNGSLTGYDAATGQQLWDLEGISGNTIPSPTVAGDRVVVGAGENSRKPDPVASARSNCCVRLTGRDGKPGCEVVWQGKKAIAHHASPLVHRGHVYIVTRAGVVYCLDLETGAERYAERLANPCWATPLAAGDRVYFFGKDGVTTVLAAGPKYVKLATNRLWSDDAFLARKEAARKRPENQPTPRPGAEGAQGGPPPLTRGSGEPLYLDAVGDVVYGVAAVDGVFFIRTGTELFSIRAAR